MRRPIRLNRELLRKAWPNLRAGCPDPRGLLKANISAQEATDIIAEIKIGGVFKTTRPNRFPQTTRLLADNGLPPRPTVLDVGASDGSTSLSTMESIRFARYYVTDRHIEAYACTTRNGTYFCDVEYNPFMYANRFVVMYNDGEKALWPMSRIVRKVFSGFDKSGRADARRMLLMNPALLPRAGSDIRLEKYDIFETWPLEKVDLVIAANILNRSYFPDARLRDAVRNLRGALKDSGRLAVIENRPEEQSNVFRLHGDRFVVEHEVGRGSDIKALVTSLD